MDLNVWIGDPAGISLAGHHDHGPLGRLTGGTVLVEQPGGVGARGALDQPDQPGPPPAGLHPYAEYRRHRSRCLTGSLATLMRISRSARAWSPPTRVSTWLIRTIASGVLGVSRMMSSM